MLSIIILTDAALNSWVKHDIINILKMLLCSFFVLYFGGFASAEYCSLFLSILTSLLSVFEFLAGGNSMKLKNVVVVFGYNGGKPATEAFR